MAVAEVEDRGSEADLRRKAKLKGKRPAPSRVRELRGFFAHGEAMRACVMVNSDEGLRYAGSWKRGRFHGRGLLTFPARDRYLGWFKYGQRFRRGTFEYGASLFVLLLGLKLASNIGEEQVGMAERLLWRFRYSLGFSLYLFVLYLYICIQYGR
jgi:hypothetical protein